jgi:hypothetical protein
MRRGDGRVEKRRGRISSMTLMSPWRGTSRYNMDTRIIFWGHPQKCVDSGEVGGANLSWLKIICSFLKYYLYLSVSKVLQKILPSAC